MCFFRVDQGPLVIVGACVVTEEHHAVFHGSGTCASGFGPEEGGREGGQGVIDKGTRRK